MLSLESPGEIGREDIARDPVAISERVCERVQRFASTRDENDIVAIARVQISEVAPDAAGCARDDRNWAGLTAARSREGGCRERSHGLA